MISIACGYDDEPDWIQYLAPGFTAGALEDFIPPIREDRCIILGHNVERYDLPLLNGTLAKMGLTSIQRVSRVSDTMRHLPKNGYAYSRSLGNMAQRFGIEAEKGSMSEYDWELVYAGDPAALERLRIYNMGDVRATLQLRRKLLERGLLGSPKTWRS